MPSSDSPSGGGGAATLLIRTHLIMCVSWHVQWRTSPTCGLKIVNPSVITPSHHFIDFDVLFSSHQFSYKLLDGAI
jgi:hypothetical protein